jgi:hypothetical protein
LSQIEPDPLGLAHLASAASAVLHGNSFIHLHRSNVRKPPTAIPTVISMPMIVRSWSNQMPKDRSSRSRSTPDPLRSSPSFQRTAHSCCTLRRVNRLQPRTPSTRKLNSGYSLSASLVCLPNLTARFVPPANSSNFVCRTISLGNRECCHRIPQVASATFPSENESGGVIFSSQCFRDKPRVSSSGSDQTAGQDLPTCFIAVFHPNLNKVARLTLGIASAREPFDRRAHCASARLGTSSASLGRPASRPDMAI